MTTTSTDKATVLEQWADLLRQAELTRAGKLEADRIARDICHNQPQYYEVMMRTGMPWQLVGAIHHLKDGGNFELHLGGDTPIEEICTWNTEAIFPGTWAKCAADYLGLRGFAMGAQDWGDVLGWLWEANKFSGSSPICQRGDALAGGVLSLPYAWLGTGYVKFLSNENLNCSVGLVPILASLGVIKIG